MNIWQFQRRLTATLMGWAAASIAVGFRLGRDDDPFRKGIGEQFTGWGLINALIAAFGAIGAGRRQELPEAQTAATQASENHKLSRLLWVNTGLDVVYVLGGVLAARTRGATNERWRGRGVGIMIQGGFLFILDLTNALLLKRMRVPGEPQL